MKRILAVATIFAASSTAFAGTDTSNMSVSATVSNSCTISAGSMDFGAYDAVAGTAVDGSATVSVACTSGSTNTITMGQGANADAGSTDAIPLRQMANGAEMLAYTLYQESGRTTVWGNTAGTGVDYTAASSASSDVTVYGTITAGQDVPAGSYSDTVVATITF